MLFIEDRVQSMYHSFTHKSSVYWCASKKLFAAYFIYVAIVYFEHVKIDKQTWVFHEAAVQCNMHRIVPSFIRTLDFEYSTEYEVLSIRGRL